MIPAACATFLAFALAASSAAAQPAKPAPAKLTDLTGTIAQIQIHVSDATLRAAVERELVGLTGKSLASEPLRAALERAALLDDVADVDAKAVQTASGIELVVDVTPQAIVRKLSAEEAGGKAIAMPASELRVGRRMALRQLQASLGVLAQRYLALGHLGVATSVRTTKVADGFELVLQVTPGPAATVATVAFTGNKAFTSGVLAREISKLVASKRPAAPDDVRSAVSAIEAYYADRGYAQIKVYGPKLIAGPNAVVFELVEGPKFRIGTVTIKGLPVTDHEKYLRILGVKQGDLYSTAALRKGAAAVRAAITAATSKGAEVFPLTQVGSSASRIDLTLEVLITR